MTSEMVKSEPIRLAYTLIATRTSFHTVRKYYTVKYVILTRAFFT